MQALIRNCPALSRSWSLPELSFHIVVVKTLPTSFTIPSAQPSILTSLSLDLPLLISLLH